MEMTERYDDMARRSRQSLWDHGYRVAGLLAVACDADGIRQKAVGTGIMVGKILFSDDMKGYDYYGHPMGGSLAEGLDEIARLGTLQGGDAIAVGAWANGDCRVWATRYPTAADWQKMCAEVVSMVADAAKPGSEAR